MREWTRILGLTPLLVLLSACDPQGYPVGLGGAGLSPAQLPLFHAYRALLSDQPQEFRKALTLDARPKYASPAAFGELRRIARQEGWSPLSRPEEIDRIADYRFDRHCSEKSGGWIEVHEALLRGLVERGREEPRAKVEVECRVDCDFSLETLRGYGIARSMSREICGISAIELLRKTESRSR
jgi:hypothetical protein